MRIYIMVSKEGQILGLRTSLTTAKTDSETWEHSEREGQPVNIFSMVLDAAIDDETSTIVHRHTT